MSEWGDKFLTEADNARLRAENAKLRERVHELEIEYDGATTAVLEKTERIEWIAGRLRGETNENAKLRELCATVIDDWMSKVCPTFPFCEYGGEYQDCTDETCGNQIYRQMARELGVEV